MFSRILDSVPISGSIKSWSFHDDSFPPAKKDLVFAYQTGQPDVKKVMAHMLVLAGISDEDRTATKIYRQLIDLHIIDPETQYLNVSAINGQKLAAKVVIITRTKLSLLVNVLFWLDEEMNRWQGAEMEKIRFAGEIGKAHPDDDEHERRNREHEGIRVITALQRELPSQRSSQGIDQHGFTEGPGVRQTREGQTEDDESLPAYTT